MADGFLRSSSLQSASDYVSQLGQGNVEIVNNGSWGFVKDLQLGTLVPSCTSTSGLEETTGLRLVDDSVADDSKSVIGSTVPHYVSLEPSLAMDWLEISWDELQIKERIGAGIFYSS